MLSDTPLAQPDIPEFRDPRFRPAIAVSLLLHLGVALALGRVATQHVGDDIGALPVSIAVADAPPNDTEPATVSNAPSTIPAGEGEIVLDQQELQNSITTFLSTYRSDSLEQDLRECQQYRDRYARWDCPEGEEPKTETQARIDDNMNEAFRDWVYGYDLNIARSEKLMTEMLALRPLLEEEGVLGEVARHAHLLREAEYERLHPGQRASGNMPIVGVIGNGGPSIGGTITFLSIGGGGLSLLNGVWGIGWNGKVQLKEQAPARKPDDGRIPVPERASVPEQ